MIRKIISLGLALALVLSMGGCFQKSMTPDIGEASKIELRSGTDGTMTQLTSPEDVKQVTDKIKALTFRKGGSSGDHSGWSYSLKWYDSENPLMKELLVMSEDQIDYEGHFYSVMEAGGKIDLSYFDALLTPG